MKKLISVGFALLSLLTLCVSCSKPIDPKYPHLIVRESDHARVTERIATDTEVSAKYEAMKQKIDVYADRHQQDPAWIVSRLAMYWKDGEHYTQCYLKDQNWDRGEGNAPVPTLRMPGMRTWNKYSNVPLEDRIPYNESGDMLGIDRFDPSAPPVLVPYKESGHMVRGNNVEIVTIAEEAAFLYWITKEERYARLATDIFYPWLMGIYYMNPILDPEKSCGSEGGWAPGGICGYYDYEQIHEDMAKHVASVYDFCHDYLESHPYEALTATGKSLDEVTSEVFKRFIDLGMIRGGKEGNWNVNGWSCILPLIMTLDNNESYADGHGRDYYLHYLLEESTEYHNALPDIVCIYDSITGLWPESPGYGFSTFVNILGWQALLQNAGVDIFASNPVLKKTLQATHIWRDHRGNLPVFGDCRGGGLDVRNSTEWINICQPSITDQTPTQTERTSYSPFHRFITMKNTTEAFPMMACLYGGRNGAHLSPNGLALQYFAYGYALVPDAAAYESYWSADHRYHQSATSSNTILPGYTEGDITVHSLSPAVPDNSFINVEEGNPLINYADVSAGEKRRFVAMVRTSDSTGYYLDIFRSAQPDNDFLFHHVGETMQLLADGRALTLTPMPRWDKKYAQGYDWLTNLRKASISSDFVVEWTLPDDIKARLWMTGSERRTVIFADAPGTTLNPALTPGGTSVPPLVTPALIVRQDRQDGWLHPFVSLYEPTRGNAYSVVSVKRTDSPNGDICLQITLADGREQIIKYSLDGTFVLN